MIRRYVLSSVVVLAMVGVTACSGQAVSTDDELVILFSAPLSGDSAESGRAMLNGAELAADAINSSGGIESGEHEGKRIRIEPTDDEMSTQAANSIASKFVSNDGYFALVGFLDSGLAQAASVVAARDDLALISTFGCGDSLITDSDNVFVMCAAPDANGRVAAAFVADQIPNAKFASISIDVPQLDFYFNGLKAVAKERNLDWINREVYPPSATDYATTVTNAMAGAPDAIISGSLQASSAQILNQIRRIDSDVLFVDMLGEGWGPTFLDIAGENAIGAYTQDLGIGLEGTGERGDVLEKYKDKYKVTMNAAAQHSYDSIMTIAKAAESATSRNDLAEAIKTISFDGLTGPVSFKNGMRADERVITMSEVTGTASEDRTVLARYSVGSDGTVSNY